MGEVLKLGGRTFAAAKHTTLAQDQHVQAAVAASGLFQLEREKGETPLEYATRLTATVVASGKAIRIVAGLLVPEGTEPGQWSPEMAADVERHLSGLTDPEDKRQFNAQLSSLVAGFFAAGLQSLTTSPRYSAPPGAESGQPLSATAAH